jgi:glycosyltransferase involved in cell wall biosynthesis
MTALGAHPEVSLELAAPLAQARPWQTVVKKYLYRAMGKNYLPEIDPLVLRENARELDRRLAQFDVDVVISMDKMPIAYAETKKPIVYFWDCTWAGNLEYPWFANLAAESIRLGHDMERRALTKCTLAVFSSEWARQSAVEDYGADEGKTHVIPLGANLETKRDIDEIEKIIGGRARDHVKLLWMGVDWKRKGGDLAFEVAQELNARGFPTTLTVVGCSPEIPVVPNFVNALGFVDKRTNRRLVDRLFSESHFLLLPSIAEASACVMCEASSFGTPSLSRRIGGIPGTVRDHINGYLFDRDAPAADYCDYIVRVFSDRTLYDELCRSSFAEYQANLNWTNTASRMVELINAKLF